MAKNDYVKQRTQELYDSLPMDKAARIACTNVRDEIIKINYKFFGYVASSVFIEGVEYEDKLQTALLSFMEMWWKYKFTPEYRDDLSFAVFFKPRISEEIRRALCTVSYTQRRWACQKAAKQLGKHWTAVTYEDLSKLDLPADDIQALKSILLATTSANIDDYELHLAADTEKTSIEDYQTDKYDTVEELLIQEMIERESALTDKDLANMADLYCIPLSEMQSEYQNALRTLHKRLVDNMLE